MSKNYKKFKFAFKESLIVATSTCNIYFTYLFFSGSTALN